MCVLCLRMGVIVRMLLYKWCMYGLFAKQTILCIAHMR